MNQPQTDVPSDHENGASSTKKVVVVGAGLSGLIAAADLTASGHDVTVFDQARSPGGRLATKKAGQATFDHGAQFFTTRSDDFKAAVNSWVEAGHVSQWCTGFETSDGYARYKSTNGMSQLAKSLADPLDVQVRSQVGAILAQQDSWTITFNIPELSPVHADAVILACPAPLALTILANGGARLDSAAVDKAKSISYHRVIALMVQTDTTPDLGPIGAWQDPADPTFSFVANNDVKGISDAPALTIHLSHEASERLWKIKDKKLQHELRDNLSAILGAAKITGFAVKRWHHAGPIKTLEERSLQVCSRPGPVVLCGDAFGGPKVEGAYLSGRAAATHVAQLLRG